jgi:hypothetical protein
MNTKHLSAYFLSSITLFGCEAYNSKIDQTSSLMNPVKIHTAYAKESSAYKASLIPIEDYYNALSLAKTKYDGESYIAQKQSIIDNYVNEGIGLVDTYCIRWFQNLDDQSRLLNYQRSNINVITQLGTALLGIGKANTNIVTSYGAFTTANAGMTENFNSAFLVAPTTDKVKEHVQNALKEKSTLLKGTSKPKTFKEAYTELEKYADLCTYDQAKAIVDKSLDITQTKINTTTQQAETVIDQPKPMPPPKQ